MMKHPVARSTRMAAVILQLLLLYGATSWVHALRNVRGAARPMPTHEHKNDTTASDVDTPHGNSMPGHTSSTPMQDINDMPQEDDKDEDENAEYGVPESGRMRDGLIDTNDQPMFVSLVPNPLDPSFIYEWDSVHNNATIEICYSDSHLTGLVNENGEPLSTSVYGYRPVGGSCTWPGRTFVAQAGVQYKVHWLNKLPVGEPHILQSVDGRSVVDTSIHWAYGLHGYEDYTIESVGVPIVTHLHGGRTSPSSDGHPEAFYSPDGGVKGPYYKSSVSTYKEDRAKLIWYHDHALGLTRLNVYAGLAGFFVMRDDLDTGKVDNPLGLPAFPYEALYAIQDRMFKADGSLFFPAFRGDPEYEDFIEEEGVTLSSESDGDGPSILAEVFGDVMVVNGIVWPKAEVEPRQYRLRYLNGCDDRFLVVQFVAVDLDVTDIPSSATPLPFTVIGTDQGLSNKPREMTTLIIEPGARYDLIFDFTMFDQMRVILRNTGKDGPFDDTFEPKDIPSRDKPEFRRADRIMAFDVVQPLMAASSGARSSTESDTSTTTTPEYEAVFDPCLLSDSITIPVQDRASTLRRVGVFEGRDPYNRMLPMLGTVGEAYDFDGNVLRYPDTEHYINAGLAGEVMEGSFSWDDLTTENVRMGDTEEWEIWNFSADAHPIHLHLASIEFLSRHSIVWDSNTNEDDRMLESDCAADDGTYLVSKPVVMHDGRIAQGHRVVNPTMGEEASVPEGYYEEGMKDIVIALPNQVTRVKMTFTKTGRYVWHCHVLSHEEHSMMRTLMVKQ
jgi:spore coat protein A, manganese oxidase